MWDLEWDEHGPRGPLGPICGFTTYFVKWIMQQLNIQTRLIRSEALGVQK